MYGKKLRTTRQRKIILEELRKLASHPTADELYEIVRDRMPRISLGTVYRNLEILSKCGVIRKLDPSYTQMRFDGNTAPHYHVVCKSCGRVQDIFCELVEDVIGAVQEHTDYEIQDYSLEFTGICPACRGSQRVEIEVIADEDEKAETGESVIVEKKVESE